MKPSSFNPFRQFKKNTDDLDAELSGLIKEREIVSELWQPPEHLIERRVGFCDYLKQEFEQKLANPNDDLFPYRGQPLMTLEGAAQFVAFAVDRDELKEKIDQAVRKYYPKQFATDEQKRERLSKIDEKIMEISRQLVAIYTELESSDVDVLPNPAVHVGVYLGLE